MTLKKFLAASVATIALMGAPALAAEENAAGEHKFEKAAAYYTECKGASAAEFNDIKPYLKAFTDSEVMAETINDPEKFFKLMDIVNDPRTVHVMMNCSMEPVMWDTWMRGLTDFEKLTKASIKAMNPVGMFKWMMAPMNANVWKSAVAHFDYNKYVRWGQAFLNPAFYRPMTDMLTDYKWYEPRLAWFVKAETYTKPLANMTKIPDWQRIADIKLN